MFNDLVAKAFKFASTAQDAMGYDYSSRYDLEGDISSTSLRSVLIGTIALVSLIAFGMVLKRRKWAKKLMVPVFVLIAFTTVAVSTLLVSLTIYLNVVSDSGGPVHWHADIEIWACDNELELRNPTGLSNKIGTATLHEHDDRRIHLEGVVVDEKVDATLGKFMHVIDGSITKDSMIVPLEPSRYFEDELDGDGPSDTNQEAIEPYLVKKDGKVTARFVNGGECNGVPSEAQVFVYQYNETDNTYEQTKLEDPASYVIRDNPNIPPGDCVIFEFGPARDRTDKLCEQYGVRDVDRCLEFGVEADVAKEFCTSKDVTPEPGEEV